MTTKKTVSLDPSWYHRFALTAVLCALIAGMLRFVLFGVSLSIAVPFVLTEGLPRPIRSNALQRTIVDGKLAGQRIS